jgi:hypothetical protein
MGVGGGWSGVDLCSVEEEIDQMGSEQSTDAAKHCHSLHTRQIETQPLCVAKRGCHAEEDTKPDEDTKRVDRAK